MASDIILYSGKPVLKESDVGEKSFTSFAFLSEHFAGIRAVGDGEVYDTQDTNKRCVLAAIRGAQIAQELEDVSDDRLVGCFQGGLNRHDIFEMMAAQSIYKELPKHKVNQIKNFVPSNIETILGTLVINKLPFDSEEINEEIRLGRIKKSSSIKDILNANNLITQQVDYEEYGQLNNMDFVVSLINDKFYEFRKLIRPFFDEYLANFNRNNYELITYGSVNLFGFCIVSKLKSDKNMNFDIHISMGLEHYGDINDISAQPVIRNFIKLKKSSEDVYVSLFNQGFLERCYGTREKFRLEEKLPILFRTYDLGLTSEEGEICSIVNDGEIIEKVGIMRDNIQRRRDMANDYDVPSIN